MVSVKGVGMASSRSAAMRETTNADSWGLRKWNDLLLASGKSTIRRAPRMPKRMVRRPSIWECE